MEVYFPTSSLPAGHPYWGGCWREEERKPWLKAGNPQLKERFKDHRKVQKQTVCFSGVRKEIFLRTRVHWSQLAATQEATGLAYPKLESVDTVGKERVNSNPLHFSSDLVTLRFCYLECKYSTLNSNYFFICIVWKPLGWFWKAHPKKV